MKKSLVILLKVVISLGLLGFLFYRFPVSLEKWRGEWENLNWGWLLLTLLTGTMANLFGMLRWHFLLKTQNIPLPFSKVVVIGWIGLFFSNFSIGVVGGDVARIFYLSKLYPDQKSKSVFSILLDRVMGFLGLCAIALLVLPLSWRWFGNANEIRVLINVLLIILAFGLLGLISLVLFRKKNFGLFYFLARQKRFQKWFEHIDQVIEACLRQKKIILGTCLSMSVGVHLSLIVCGYCLARAFSLPVPFFLMAAIMPMVNIAISLPITISGLGVREALILLLFQSSHLGEGKALLFSLSLWLAGLILAAGGGVFYIFYRCSNPEKTDKITSS